jgi:hypothetical protein
METEEETVYAALLQSMYPDLRLVLAEKTATDPGGAENTASVLESALKQMGEVDPQTAASFQVRNDAQYPLRPGMNIGLEYVLLTEDNMRQIFNVNQNELLALNGLNLNSKVLTGTKLQIPQTGNPLLPTVR